MSILEFEASDYQILETFEFVEEIQRPEAMRFFTLEEQLTDFVDKNMPLGKATRYQIQELQKERDRLQEVYVKVIEQPSRIRSMPSWIHPLHSEFTYFPYDYETQWVPVMNQRTVPNSYPRLILALPKPYSTKKDESPLIQSTTYAVNETRLQHIGLGPYERTKGVLHEDGTLTIVGVPLHNTQDDMRIKGYLLDRRPLEIPHPLPDHPFLRSNESSTILTTEPFVDIFPSIDAILTHGVPTTTDPYEYGNTYLRLYDIRWSDIPWDAWKRRFPPVELTESPAPVSIPFANPEQKTPSANLLKVYTPYQAGLDPYLWLMMQEDGGAFVPRLLLSQASDAGLLPVVPIGELVEPSFPDSTPDDCIQATSFDSFLQGGLYRNGKCIPVPFIQHEQHLLISSGRKGWSDSTEHDLLASYQRNLLKVSRTASTKPITTYDVHEVHKVPELRKEIRLLLADPKRLDIDKKTAIETLLRDIIPTNHVFVDASNSFLVCEHTLTILQQPDMDSFYREWTFIESGYRVCKYCGEQINRDVFMAQDEFDDAGHVIKTHERLPVSIYHGESEFATSLNELKRVFDLDKSKHIGRMILYLLLSLFQVVPFESQLLPVLTFMDGISGAMKVAKKGSDEVDGATGIVGMAILLQTHNPFLIPRRSFGSKQLKLSGFPRDTDDSTKVPVIQTILFVLQSTFESFPTTFVGPVASFMRSLNKNVRTLAIQLLGKSVSRFKTQFEDAKQRYNAMPEDVQIDQLQLPLRPVSSSTKETIASCHSYAPLTYLVGHRGPNVSQEPLSLQSIHPSSIHRITPEQDPLTNYNSISVDSIRSRLKLGFPFKIPLLSSYIESEQDGISLLSLLYRLKELFNPAFPVPTLQTRIDPSTLRDIARGFLYQLLHTLKEEKQIATAVKQDMILKLLITNKDDAQKEDQGLRARERETLKSRLRQKGDAERELLKMLLDIGIAPYIITNKDREQFAQELNVEPEVEPEEHDIDVVQGQDEDRDIEDNTNGLRNNRDEDYAVGQQAPVDTD